jgi:hypothetical protein
MLSRCSNNIALQYEWSVTADHLGAGILSVAAPELAANGVLRGVAVARDFFR